MDLHVLFNKNLKNGLKWVHLARYELILKLDGALRLTIILRPLLTPKGYKKPKITKKPSPEKLLNFVLQP